MLPYMHALVNSYTKGVHLDAFQACVDNTKLKLYTTVILLVAKFHEMQAVSHRTWMIGRGLISDPFYPV
jgi:hypothetical protein